MILKKSEIKALGALCKGADSRQILAKHLKVTPNRITPIIKRLHKLGFVEKEINNRQLMVKLSKAPHAQDFRTMIIREPGTKYHNFLYGLSFRILSYTLYSWKPFCDIATQLEITEKTVMNRSIKLRNMQLINKKDHKIKFNRNSWPSVYNFLSSCRNYSKVQGNVIWKFEKEILIETLDQPENGIPTGFSAYSEYNIPINLIRQLYYVPEKKLKKEEIFMHSLIQIRKETRLLELAAVFYYKHKLNKKKLEKLAIKYDSEKIYNYFQKAIKTKSGQINKMNLPLGSAQGIDEMLKKYKVKR
jgi:predicted transcriptional regulator